MSPEGHAPAHVTPTATEAEKPLAAVAYILTWLTGLIIFLVAKKEQRYARWNAVQSIALGVVATVLWIALSMLSAIFSIGAAGFAAAGLMGLLGLMFSVLVLVLVILLAVKAYQGQPMRLPLLADFADKYA